MGSSAESYFRTLGWMLSGLNDFDWLMLFISLAIKSMGMIKSVKFISVLGSYFGICLACSFVKKTDAKKSFRMLAFS